jgi:hypothetical protein
MRGAAASSTMPATLPSGRAPDNGVLWHARVGTPLEVFDLLASTLHLEPDVEPGLDPPRHRVLEAVAAGAVILSDPAVFSTSVRGMPWITGSSR